MAITTRILQTMAQSFRKYWVLALLALVVIVAGLLFTVINFQGASGRASGTVEAQDINLALVRYGNHPETEDADMTVFLLTPTYFDATGRIPPDEVVTESLLFYISEDTHSFELPLDPPRPLLRVDGGQRLEPADIKILADTEHHRAMLVRYAAVSPGGELLVSEDTQRLEIIFGDRVPGSNSIVTLMKWDLPIEYNEKVVSREVVIDRPMSGEAAAVTSSLMGNQAITWGAFLAIMAGLLIALSPCLVQLGVYYTAIMAAAGVERDNPDSLNEADAKKHIIQTGLFFTIGFMGVYTVAGAAAGSIGQSLDTLGLFNVWLRPLGIAAGIIIILLAVRVAWNARAPLICHLPMPAIFGKKRRTGVLGSALMGISFAGGCLACFGATVLPALLLYAGGTGSVVYGALLLFTFSLGIALPCLLLAFGISRFQPLLQRLYRFGPSLALASALVMVGFGLLMITNQFHILSGFIGQFLNI